MRPLPFVLVLLFTNCTPSPLQPVPPNQVPTTTASANPAGYTATSGVALSPAAATSPAAVTSPAAPTSVAPNNPTAAATDSGTPPAPCGLPPVLRARGWAEELSPVAQERPDAPEAGTVTIAVLPDTQYYTSCRYPHFANQVQWLTQNATALNLKAAVHLGDITESNVKSEWIFARNALGPLLDLVPTFLATGNHDHGELGKANRHWTQFNQFFTPLAPATQATLASTAVPGDNENAYYRLALPKVTIGVLVLGWSPRQATVDWANRVLTQFATDRVIFVTHAYLYTDSTRYDWARRGAAQEWNPYAYGVGAPASTTATAAGASGSSGNTASSAAEVARDVYDGERLWTSLISRHKGIFLTLNGHVLHHGTGRLASTGQQGNEVQQVLVNYQMLSEGGSGYLRLLELTPDGKSMRFRTYSPSLKQWAVAPDQHFDLPIKPALW